MEADDFLIGYSETLMIDSTEIRHASNLQMAYKINTGNPYLNSNTPSVTISRLVVWNCTWDVASPFLPLIASGSLYLDQGNF